LNFRPYRRLGLPTLGDVGRLIHVMAGCASGPGCRSQGPRARCATDGIRAWRPQGRLPPLPETEPGPAPHRPPGPALPQGRVLELTLAGRAGSNRPGVRAHPLGRSSLHPAMKPTEPGSYWRARAALPWAVKTHQQALRIGRLTIQPMKPGPASLRSESAHIMPRLKPARATQVVRAPRPSARIVALPTAVATDTVPAPGDRSTTKVHSWSVAFHTCSSTPARPDTAANATRAGRGFSTGSRRPQRLYECRPAGENHPRWTHVTTSYLQTQSKIIRTNNRTNKPFTFHLSNLHTYLLPFFMY
jgi:hypothetical protein